MRREVQSILLVLTGGALIRLSMSGTFVNFVKPRLGPYLISAGVVLVVLGLWGALRDDSPGRAHEHRGPRTAWLLLLPVLTIFLVAPPPLGSFAAGRGGNSVPQPASGDLPALTGDPANLDVVDFVVRAVWDDRETLKGHRVRMTGFVTDAPGGGWYLTRMRITCCAADAEPFKIKTLAAPPFPADTWVRVVGEWVPGAGRQRSDAIPVVRVESVVEVAQPTHPYE